MYALWTTESGSYKSAFVRQTPREWGANTLLGTDDRERTEGTIGFQYTLYDMLYIAHLRLHNAMAVFDIST